MKTRSCTHWEWFSKWFGSSINTWVGVWLLSWLLHYVVSILFIFWLRSGVRNPLEPTAGLQAWGETFVNRTAVVSFGRVYWFDRLESAVPGSCTGCVLVRMSWATWSRCRLPAGTWVVSHLWDACRTCFSIHPVTRCVVLSSVSRD